MYIIDIEGNEGEVLDGQTEIVVVSLFPTIMAEKSLITLLMLE